MQNIKWVLMSVLVMGSVAQGAQQEPLSPKEAKRKAAQLAHGKITLTSLPDDQKKMVKEQLKKMARRKQGKAGKAQSKKLKYIIS